MIVSFLYLVVFLSGGAYEVWRIIALVSSIGTLNEALSKIDADSVAYSQVQFAITGNIIELIVVIVLLILTIICIIRFIWFTFIQNAAFLLKTKTSDVIKTTNNP